MGSYSFKYGNEAICRRVIKGGSMNDKKLTVGQIAQRFGVSARTIRHYEAIGILKSSRDTESNYRLYGEAELNRIYQIMLLKDMGFSLKEISSVITSDGNKNIIIRIINNRLKILSKKTVLYNQCIDLLTEFLNTCSSQQEDKIDSFRLLNELLLSKKEDEIVLSENSDSSWKANLLEEDSGLKILRSCRSEDLNALYLPFVLDQEDGFLLENFFIDHRRFWGLRNVFLSDGTTLEDVYNPYNFINVILGKLVMTAWDSGIYQEKEELTYQNIVTGFCLVLTGMEVDSEDTMQVLELKLIRLVFDRALEILELAGKLDEAMLAAICRLLKIEDEAMTKRELEMFLVALPQSDQVQAYYMARVVNEAVKRNRYAGPFYVLTEPSAFESDCWEFDRALDMAVSILWSHEINPAGQPYKTLAPVIFQVAFMRTRELYASTVHTVPEIMDVEEFRVIGLELVTTDRDGEGFARIPGFEEEYIAQGAADRIPNRARPGLRYGISTRHSGENYSFISGEEVSSLEEIPQDMTGELIPAGKYAVFTVRGGPLPYKVIETIIYIYQSWLPASEYQWVKRPGFHLYENANGRNDSVIKIYVPVERKELNIWNR
jgi:DNA-binding transcriptional MerR regulator/predicted transcriptional regulator YdeE